MPCIQPVTISQTQLNPAATQKLSHLQGSDMPIPNYASSNVQMRYQESITPQRVTTRTNAARPNEAESRQHPKDDSEETLSSPGGRERTSYRHRVLSLKAALARSNLELARCNHRIPILRDASFRHRQMICAEEEKIENFERANKALQDKLADEVEKNQVLEQKLITEQENRDELDNLIEEIQAGRSEMSMLLHASQQVLRQATEQLERTEEIAVKGHVDYLMLYREGLARKVEAVRGMLSRREAITAVARNGERTGTELVTKDQEGVAAAERPSQVWPAVGLTDGMDAEDAEMGSDKTGMGNGDWVAMAGGASQVLSATKLTLLLSGEAGMRREGSAERVIAEVFEGEAGPWPSLRIRLLCEFASL